MSLFSCLKYLVASSVLSFVRPYLFIEPENEEGFGLNPLIKQNRIAYRTQTGCITCRFRGPSKKAWVVKTLPFAFSRGPNSEGWAAIWPCADPRMKPGCLSHNGSARGRPTTSLTNMSTYGQHDLGRPRIRRKRALSDTCPD